MLKTFTVDNFKSLINVTFEPAGLNLLVGSNNAGKTNLCQSLRFLSLTSRMLLDDAAAECTAEPWNLLNVYLDKESLNLGATCALVLKGQEFSFVYELSLVPKEAARGWSRGRPLEVAKEALRVSGGQFSNTLLLENHEGHVRLLHEGRFKQTPSSEGDYVETAAPTNATMLHRLYDLETNQFANLFKKYLGSWGYYNFDPYRLRMKQARSMDQTLESAGSNLSSVMLTLHNANPRVEQSIIEGMKLLEPRLDWLTYQTPDPDHVYMFFEDRKKNKFGVDSVSDGSLRYLAMSYLMLSRGGGDDEAVPPVIVIEEPENGIFVGHLKPLFKRIDPSGQSGQFIFTSHNPYFIDLFDGTLDGVFLMKAGETHSSLVRPDRALLHERLGQFSLGEMHFRGLLE